MSTFGRRVAGLTAIVALLVACDPGEPDIDYGRYSVVPAPTGAVLGPDGSVFGASSALMGDTPIRLDALGHLDVRWREQLPMYVTSLVPGIDGGVVVIGRDDINPGFDVRIQRIAADGQTVGVSTVLKAVEILDARDLPAGLRLVVVEGIDASSGDFDGLAMIDIDDDGGVRRVRLASSFADIIRVWQASAAINADGSFAVADHTPDASPSAYANRLRRFDANGSPAVGFGDGGVVLTTSIVTCEGDEAPYADLAPASAPSTVWVALSCGLGDTNLVRLTGSGAADTAFSGGSLTFSELDPSPEIRSVQLFPQEDGTAFVALSTCFPQPRFDCVGQAWQLARFDATGVLDPNWGIDGLARPLVDSPFSIRSTARGVMLLGLQRMTRGGNQLMVHRLVGPQAAS